MTARAVDGRISGAWGIVRYGRRWVALRRWLDGRYTAPPYLRLYGGREVDGGIDYVLPRARSFDSEEAARASVRAVSTLEAARWGHLDRDPPAVPV